MSYSYRSIAKPSSRYRQNRPQRNNRRSVKFGVYIDPSRFVKAATAATDEVYLPTHKFTDFALEPILQANLTAKGYDTPSPIQDQAIPVALEGRDVIGIASTGTGKTAAFALPILQKLMTDRNSGAIIVAPTRELAEQIEDECRSLAKRSGLFSALLIGGSSMGNQLRDLRERPRIVIGTPGRIKDHLNRGTLKLHNFNIVVLDEVDRMLDMGFVDDVTEILKQTSQVRQSLFFSATMDNRVRSLVESFTHEPVSISLKTNPTADSVHQDVVMYSGSSDKIEKLNGLLRQDNITKVIVFDETQRSVERLSNELITRGFSADAIHGGKTQGQRQRALASFKKNHIKILVATDVAARGIDVADITHVINFSVPKTYDDYVHRIGRTGRAGQIGYALTFVAE